MSIALFSWSVCFRYLVRCTSSWFYVTFASKRIEEEILLGFLPSQVLVYLAPHCYIVGGLSVGFFPSK
jgi:hypothetical protein